MADGVSNVGEGSGHVLTPRDIKRLRKLLGWTRYQMGAYLKVSFRTVEIWEEAYKYGWKAKPGRKHMYVLRQLYNKVYGDPK